MPLTAPQLEIYNDPTRFRVIIAGRRFGKSVLCLNELIRAAQTGYNLDVYYVAPYLKMAKGILWPMLKAAIPKSHVKYKNEQELVIELKQYNSRIHLVGADNADALRGISVSFLVADEIQDIPLNVLDTVLLPAMADQKSDGIYIGTPKGKGDNTAYQLYLRGKTIKNWKSWHYTTAEGGNVDPEEIEAAKAVMSPKQFEAEFMASFVSMQGRVYYNFDVNETIDNTIFDRGLPLHIGLDFNVGKMCAVVCQEFGGIVEVIDEFVLVDSNTREMCQAIQHRYPDRHITIYPDPSGKARKTSANAGQTDFSIIKDKEFGFEFNLLAKNKHPAVADRVNNVNAMLMSADGTRKLKISPKAVEMIKCLDGQVYKEGTNQPDKDGGLDHQCFSGDTRVEVFGLGELAFRDIPSAGLVRSPFGGWVGYTRGGLVSENQAMVSVITEDGKQINCTPDHKFLTTKGWVEAKDLLGSLVISSQILCHKRGKFNILSLFKHDRDSVEDVLANGCSGVLVKEVVSIPNEDTYCLTTDNFGCFSLANGLVVSNCDALGYYIDYRFDLIKREVKTLTLNWAY